MNDRGEKKGKDKARKGRKRPGKLKKHRKRME